MRNFIRLNHRGSALITSLIISLVLIALLSLYGRFSFIRSRENVSGLAKQKALEYADSGINDALAWLRAPEAGLNLLNTSYVIPVLKTSHDKGRSETTITRTSDPNYITADATGYFYIQQGSTVDPDTNRKAHIAVVHATLLFRSVTQYLAAVDNPLHIADQSNLGNGVVYSPDLIFDGSAWLGAAYYSNSVYPSETPPGVTITIAPNRAQQLPTPLNVATIDSAIQQLYQNRATTDALTITGGRVNFIGSIGPQTNETHVYYVTAAQAPNGVHIGQSGITTQVRGVYTIYASTDIYIHGDIRPFDSNSWVALVSERTIHLAADAPDVLTIEANLVANGGVVADAASRPAIVGGACALVITGGMVGQASPNFSLVWTSSSGCERDYTYRCFTGPQSRFLYLPNLSTLLDYKIIKGRYR